MTYTKYQFDQLDTFNHIIDKNADLITNNRKLIRHRFTFKLHHMVVEVHNTNRFRHSRGENSGCRICTLFFFILHS